HLEAYTCTGRRFGKLTNVVVAVRAHCDSGFVRQPGQPVQLPRTGYFVRNQHIADTTTDHDLCFRDLLAADADGSVCKLLMRDQRRLVGFRMRPDANAVPLRQILHALEIALERIEVDDERRCRSEEHTS